MQVDLVTRTDGKGYWSNKAGVVRITKLFLNYYDGSRFGELCAEFHPDDWNWHIDGLIYTDDLWEKEFKSELERIGFPASATLAVSYSEQGMQGDSYVSLDVGKAFLHSELGEKLILEMVIRS